MSWCPIHQVSDCEHIHLAKSKVRQAKANNKQDFDAYIQGLQKKAYAKLIEAGEGANYEELDQP